MAGAVASEGASAVVSEVRRDMEEALAGGGRMRLQGDGTDPPPMLALTVIRIP